tara:strand:- start:500 stop:679 length:180 start_codon:yes stop_codon:yes gene_type:complete
MAFRRNKPDFEKGRRARLAKQVRDKKWCVFEWPPLNTASVYERENLFTLQVHILAHSDH